MNDELIRLYGILPSAPKHLSVFLESEDRGARDVIKRRLSVCVELDGGHRYTFALFASVPRGDRPVGAVINIGNARCDDEERASFSFSPYDITKPSRSFKSGIAPYLVPHRRRRYAAGKLMIYAWCAMRVMDYIEALPYVNKSDVTVSGEELFGEAAMLACRLDSRLCPPVERTEYASVADMPYLFAPSAKENI